MSITTHNLVYLFVQVFDAQQTITFLEKLKNTPGYTSLTDHPHFVPSPSGNSETLMSIGLVMPQATQMMQDYGGVLYVDATFGLVMLSWLALLVVVVDGEGHNHLVSCFLTPGHDEEEWCKLFDAIAGIDGVKNMSKCVLMHDEEPAIKSAFEKSKIPHLVTVSTCTLHTKWSLAKKKMSNGTQFGADAARKYSNRVRTASCVDHYEWSLNNLHQEFLDKGDQVRADHVLGVLAVKDTPLCKLDEVFMGLTNNPAEQSNAVYKKPKKGIKMSLLTWVCKTVDINRRQSTQPKVEIKKLDRLRDEIEQAKSDNALDDAR